MRKTILIHSMKVLLLVSAALTLVGWSTSDLKQSAEGVAVTSAVVAGAPFGPLKGTVT